MAVINVEVRVRDGEPIGSAIKRFIKKVKKEGVLDEYYNRMRHTKKSDKKRMERRNRKRNARSAQRKRDEQIGIGR